jgi:predicted nucleic-acid-binding protein
MTVQLGYLDTNIFVHSLYPNDRHYLRCREIIAALESGAAQGWIDRIVVYELTFILARGKRFPDRPALTEYVRSIITMGGVRVEDEELLITALDRWANQGVSFADAWLFVQAMASGQPICTVNARDFKGAVNTF